MSYSFLILYHDNNNTAMAVMATRLQSLAFLALSCSSLVYGQKAGSHESHPSLTTQHCTTAGGCTTIRSSVVLDSGTHAITDVKSGASCLTSGGSLNTTICPNAQTCAKNCAIQGIQDYASYGVTTSGDALNLKMYLDGKSVSPRVYLLDESGKNYETMQLNGQEFTFDVDVSNLPCGMNGALYFSQMDADGGRSRLNPAGATYGVS